MKLSPSCPAVLLVVVCLLTSSAAQDDAYTSIATSADRLDYNTVIIILTTLIVFTIAFEYTKDAIQEAADGPMEPILNSLFGEMTVLGFLGLLSFLATRSGYLQNLSQKTFGDPDSIPEDLEDVHMLLFLVMVTFLVEALLLVRFGKRLERKWRAMEKETTDEDSVWKKHLAVAHMAPKFKFELLKGTNVSGHELITYHLLRQEFIKSSATEKDGGAKEKNALPKDFDFSEYLSRVLGESLGSMVSISWKTWAVMEVIYVFFWAIFSYTDRLAQLIIFIVFEIVMLGLLLFVRFHMDFVRLQLIPPIHSHPKHPKNKGWARVQTNVLEEGASLVNSHHPPFLRQVPQKRRKVGSFFLGSPPNKHENLFVLDKHGPAFLFFIIQLSLLITAVSVAAFSFYFAPFTIAMDIAVYLKILFFILALLPPLLIFFEFIPYTICRHVEVCNVGLLKKMRHIGKVIRHQKTTRSLRALKLLQIVSWNAHVQQETNAVSVADDSRDLNTAEIHEMREMFNLFDKDGSGSITIGELGALFRALGQHIDEVDLNMMVKAVDADGTGDISFDEFCQLMKKRRHVKEMDPEESMKLLFAIFDKDGSGSITSDEFAQVVNSLGQEFSRPEIEDLMREIDENGDGEVDLEEFTELMRKHLNE